MMNRLRGVGLCLLLVPWAAIAGCAGPEPAAEGSPDPATLPVPEPDLSAMDPALARWLEGMRNQVAEEASGDAGPEEAGKLFGELGQLYYVFDLQDAAETAFRNAHRLVPEEPRWAYLLASVQRDAGEFEEARESFERALDLDPDFLPAWLRRGDLELEVGRPEEAATFYGRALELDPSSAAALFGLGQVAMARGEPASAVDYFERALELQPRASTIHYQLAQAYRQLGRPEDAERHLAQRGTEGVRVADPIAQDLRDLKTVTAFQVVLSLAADPQGRSPEEVLGLALTQLGDMRGAVEQVEGALDRRIEAEAPAAELARLHYVAGGLRIHAGEDTAAEAHLRRALELDPDLTDARVKLGNVGARQGRFGEAAELYARALRERPDDRELRLKLASAWVNDRRLDAAIPLLEELVTRDPLDAEAQVGLAEALEISGQRAAAEARYRKALELPLETPAAARIHRGLGDFHRRGGNLETAASSYRRAVELDPRLLSARERLAATLVDLGRLEEALEQFAEVVARNPDDVEARRGEAAILIFSGRLAEAKNRLESALAYRSDSLEPAHLLARILAAAPDPEIRDGLRALELARQVFERRPSPAAAETVAMALAEQGRFDEAARWQQRVVGEPGAVAAEGNAWARLTLYRSGRPYRAEAPEDYLPGAISSGS